MKKITIEMEHCYGIKRLKAEFDFAAHGNVVAVYAPNGVMKTSLANTFRDLSLGSQTSDRVWPAKLTKRVILDEQGKELPRECIFVVEPYNQGFRSEKISTLLVNDELRKRYDAIHKTIDEKAEVLIAELKPKTGLKEGIREELAEAITHDRKDFYRALGRIKDEVRDEKDTPLGDVVYSNIFNPKVAELLADSSFREKVRAYIEKFNELLSKSTFFKKGIFTHNNAADIAKSLHSNGFFKASHSVFLRIGGEKKEIGSLKELEGAIQTEKDRILTDDALKSAFEAIDKLLTKNTDLRTFRQCLEQNQIVLPELGNPERLKQKLWVAYLIRSKDKFNELLDTFDAGKVKIAEIVEEAKKERTRWGDVISIFNDRFSVPFVVRMENQEDVILKRDAPTISFDFLEDPNDKTSPAVPVAEGSLMQVLSNGEKRALYILNIIFEVEARKAAKQNTLFVIDDIADSFDYKNKYAIIEYLREVGEEAGFRQLILSHNFDFYRTVAGRLNVRRKHRMFASKSNDQVSLTEEFYQKSPFAPLARGPG
jgi:ABC-type lipoprotein export system ATPase subunit